MTFAFACVVAVAIGLGCFAWACEHAPIEETELERRDREDREVAALDAIYYSPAYDRGMHSL